MSGKVTRTVQERFDEKWMPEPNSGCWLWIGGSHPLGYGKLWIKDRLEMATRVSWFLRYGYWSESNLQLCHRCDTPACVNPDHLFLGTQLDNTRDAIAKGRINPHKSGFGKDWTVARKRNAIKKHFCKYGHPLSGSNLYVSPKGHAGCKQCRLRQHYACLERQRNR